MAVVDGIVAEPVVIKPKRDKPVRQRHPWIFSGAIQRLPACEDGAVVSVVDSKQRWIAQGYLNRHSQIAVRLLSWDEHEAIDDRFWERRLAASVARRASLAGDPNTDVYRLVNAESDYLPGLTVDRYGAYLVLQAGTLGIDRRKERLAELLMALTDCDGVIERSDAVTRRQEGLVSASGLLAGRSPADNTTIVVEHGLHYHVDLLGGQKTGFYADQRENRQLVAAYCGGKRVLNAFSYTGAFGLQALAAGAVHVTNVDSSSDALAFAEQDGRLNGFDPASCMENIGADLFRLLRQWRDLGDDGPRYDVIVLDPPKFAQSKRSVDRALRGYKDVNRLAMQMLRPNGILATFSCSGLVSADLFQKVIFGASIDAECSVQILEWLHQPADHPVAITFPEGQYLKGLICRVL